MVNGMRKRLIIVCICLRPLAQANTTPMDSIEVSISDFQEFVEQTGLVTKAESNGGMVFENG